MLFGFGLLYIILFVSVALLIVLFVGALIGLVIYLMYRNEQSMKRK